MLGDHLSDHESLDLHELVNMKTLGLAKSKLMQGLVFDDDLRALMQKDVEQTKKDLEALQKQYETVSFSGPVPVSRPTPIVGEGDTHDES